MSKLKDLFHQITTLFSPYIEQERATSWGQIYSQVDSSLWNSDSGIYLHEIYNNDAGDTYAIGSREGKLFRASVVTVGGEATVGEWTPVEVQHVPVSEGVTVFRQEDGRYRWAGISCTAILNKDSEIDSTALFDHFVARFEKRDLAQSPVRLDFYHEDIFFGEVDYVARDGYALITSGLFYDTEIGRAAAQGLEADPDYWGQSIFYHPSAAPALIDIGDDIQFPVWEDGELERVALLPRDRASAWFTTINTRSIEMNPKVLDALRRLIGEDKAESLAGQTDDINKRVVDEEMIARKNQDQTPDPVAPDPEPEPEPVAPVAADLSAAPPDVVVIREMRTQQTEMLAVLETLTLTLDQFVADIQARMVNLEASEQERREAWVSDLPPVQHRAVVRPRLLRQDADDNAEQTVDTSARVAALLASKGIKSG